MEKKKKKLFTKGCFAFVVYTRQILFRNFFKSFEILEIIPKFGNSLFCKSVDNTYTDKKKSATGRDTYSGSSI